MCEQASYSQLSFKLATLLRESFFLYTLQDLQRKLDKFRPAVENTAAAMLLQRGRK